MQACDDMQAARARGSVGAFSLGTPHRRPDLTAYREDTASTLHSLLEDSSNNTSLT
jgi:hypothetical protein